MPTLRGRKRTGTSTLQATKEGPVRNTTWEFYVVADYPGQPDSQIEAATGLTLNSFVAGYGYIKSFTTSFDPQRTTEYTVSVDVSTQLDDDSGSDGTDTDDPTAWTPIYKTQFERLQEVSITDVNGDLIANSAGQPFPNGITLARYILVWDLYQFEPATVTDETIADRNEVVNSTSFRGRAAKTLLCTVADSEIGFYYGRKLRFTRYQLRYNKKKWTDKREDIGTVYLDGADLKPYLDDSGNVFLGPLDGSGGKQTAGDPAEILEFDQYPSVSFSFLRT